MFSWKCWRRGGGRSSQKNFPDTPKKFSGYTKFFRKSEKNFPDIPKNLPDVWYFSRKWKQFSGNNIDSSFQKCPLCKKCNLNDMFYARKGHLTKLGGPGPPVPTPLTRDFETFGKAVEADPRMRSNESGRAVVFCKRAPCEFCHLKKTVAKFGSTSD
jgi:hypothetical protein